MYAATPPPAQQDMHVMAICPHTQHHDMHDAWACSHKQERQAQPSLATCLHMHMHGHHTQPLLTVLPCHVPSHACTYAHTHMAHTCLYGMKTCTCAWPHGTNAHTCTWLHDTLAHLHGQHLRPLLGT